MNRARVKNGPGYALSREKNTTQVGANESIEGSHSYCKGSLHGQRCHLDQSDEGRFID